MCQAGWVALGLVAVTASQGQTQVVRGRVLEAETRKPVAGARVTLRRVTDSAATGIPASTQSDGTFSARAGAGGQYLVEVVRLGYRPQRQGPFDVRAGAVIDVEILLSVVPITLDPVTVSAQASERMLQRVGFYDRQRADFGHFITRDNIASRRASRPTDLLRVIPGVGIVPDPRSPGKVRIQMRGSHLAQGGACAPRVFMDGLIIIRGDSRPVGRPGTAKENEIERALDADPRNPEPSLDDVVNPDQIEAIEVYRSASQVPAEFGGAGVFTRCGVVVIWTRRGRS